MTLLQLFLLFTWAWQRCGATALDPPRQLEKRIDTVLSPLLPDKDPFYKAPESVASFKPGSIIRSRPTPNMMGSFGVEIEGVNRSFQLLYRTTDNLGNATATVLTVMIPENVDYRKILSFQTAGDYAATACAPSYSGQLGNDLDNNLKNYLMQAEFMVMQARLTRGWIVIVPDFEGPEAAFLANILAGQATLDGIRAALSSSDITGIEPDAAVSLMGYSGGSLASLEAAELQPSYAPELNITSVAAGGVPARIEGVLRSIKGLGALVPTGFVGLASQYPEFSALLDEQLQYPWYNIYRLLYPNWKRDRVYTVTRQCLLANTLLFGEINSLDLLQDPDFPHTNPVAIKILSENSLGKTAPQIPIYIFHGTSDEVAPIDDADNLVSFYCAGGTKVKYDRLNGLVHFAGYFNYYKAFIWTENLLNGDSAASVDHLETCETSTYSPFTKLLFEGEFAAFYAFLDQVVDIKALLSLNPAELLELAQKYANYALGFEEAQNIVQFIRAIVAGDIILAIDLFSGSE